MRNARSQAGVDGGTRVSGPRAPPAPGFSAAAVPGVLGRCCDSVYAAAAGTASPAMSRVRDGSTLTPGDIVVVSVIVRR